MNSNLSPFDHKDSEKTNKNTAVIEEVNEKKEEILDEEAINAAYYHMDSDDIDVPSETE